VTDGAEPCRAEAASQAHEHIGTIGGLCDWTDTLIADEQPARMTLTVRYSHPRIPSCSGMPGFAVYRARLAAPVGRRQLIDGVTGKRIPFFYGNRILRPSYVPPGYVFRYDAPAAYELPGFEYLAAFGGSASCSRLYTTGDPNDLLVITQAVGRNLPWPLTLKPRPVRVHGHGGLVAPGRISWTEDGQTVVVATNNTTLPQPALLAVADSLGRNGQAYVSRVADAGRKQAGG
jgi:hypothetical protein